MIEVSEQTLDRMHTLLAGIQDVDKKVLKPALARGLSAGKTQAKKAVTENYYLKPKEFARYSRIEYKNVDINGSEIIGSIKFSGGVIPLIRFMVTPKENTHGKKSISAAIKKNGGYMTSNLAFVEQMKSGHIGVFDRGKKEDEEWGIAARSKPLKINRGGNEGKVTKTKHNQKIRQRYGPSVPKMLEDEKVMQSIEDRVNEIINKRIDHEIGRLLDQNGG